MSAPLYNALAEGPQEAEAHWLTAADGTRLRAGLWQASASKGTVFLLPGRTEYVEKYGRTAEVLARAGYATLSIDWRGQGMADRPLPDRMVGHVADFAEYQRDLDALLAFARRRGLPEPWHMLAHSMGGCIGLRGLMRNLPFRAAAFTAPMWGILIPAWQKPLAEVLSALSRHLRFDHLYTPGTGRKTYVTDVPFTGNTLTTDAVMWDYMKQQALAHPELSLGGPSLGWLRAALVECHTLGLLPAPDLGCLCALGSQERVVDPGPIHRRMQSWPKGRLMLVQGAEHEVLMERPALRDGFLAEAVALFAAN